MTRFGQYDISKQKSLKPYGNSPLPVVPHHGKVVGRMLYLYDVCACQGDWNVGYAECEEAEKSSGQDYRDI